MFTEVFRQYILASSTPLVVAVSGGPDSMCVLQVLYDLYVAQQSDLTQIHVAHYHHNQRSESDDELLMLQ